MLLKGNIEDMSHASRNDMKAYRVLDSAAHILHGMN